MATNTTNYNLIKPAQDDFYNVDDFNINADIIDAELKNLDNRITAQTSQIEDISENIKIKTNITILATGWIDDTASSGFWKNVIINEDIDQNTIVDINIHLLDLEKANNLKSANISSNGKVTIYSDDRLTEDLTADLKLVRQVII